MKTLAIKILVLLCLATGSGLTIAGERFDTRQGYTTIGNPEWRLGSFRGGVRGYEILYRTSRGNRWQIAPGAAMAIGDGWVLGTDRLKGGYGIYRWNGRGWSRMPGAAVRIGGSYRQPWVINDRGIRYVWNGYDWRQDHHANRREPGRRDDGSRRHHDERGRKSR